MANALLINAENEECTFVTTKDIKDIQGHVGGWFEMLPLKQDQETLFIAYANEEGEMMRLHGNFKAGRLLHALGFELRFLMRPFIPAGNILVLSKSEKAFTKKEMGILNDAIAEDEDE